jgi:DNA-binding transcriptional LysR family regulator
LVIKIEMLRCFATVARSGKLADAADKLGRTPSAVSMMLKQFEAHLGAPLFESGRKSKLTALGAFALDEALRELDHFERTVAAIQDYARSESGFVRVAAVPSVAGAILPKAVRRFLHDHPGVRVDIRDMDSVAVLRELERERVDLGLATGTGASAGIDRDELFSDALGVICRVDHPLAAGDLPLDWRALDPWPFIANGVCGHITDENFQRVFTGSQLMVRNTTSLLALVRAGAGVTVLPQLVIEGTEGDIRFLPVADPAARRRIEILRRAHSALSPAARNFEHAVRRTALEVAATW